MAQFMGVPGPSQEEFDALSDQVTALNGNIENRFRAVSTTSTATIQVSRFPTLIAIREIGVSEGVIFLVTSPGDAYTVSKWGSKSYTVSMQNGTFSIGTGNLVLFAIG